MFLYNHKIHRRTFGSSDLNPGSATSATTSLPYKNQGIAARVTYAFRDKYMLEFNMGYNGSENFASGHRFGFFPAVSGGWMISEEPFWSSLRNAVNTFKIRGSYGKVGNDQLGNDDRWLYLSTIITGNSFTWVRPAIRVVRVLPWAVPRTSISRGRRRPSSTWASN